MQRQIIHLASSLYFLASVATGARISTRSQLDNTAVSTRIGPDGERWQTGIKYACMQKWHTGGAFSSEAQFVDQFCLVDLDKALLLASLHLQFSNRLEDCVSDKEPHKMRVCAVKGEKPEGRISWSTKTRVPKSCFRFSISKRAYPVIEASVDEMGCEAIVKSPSDAQGEFGKAIARATTTTTTTTTASEASVQSSLSDSVSPTIRCLACKAGFESEIVRNACICKPAPCEIIGARGVGPDCECIPGTIGHITWNGTTASGECLTDAKSLFTEGSMKVWAHKGKEIKCCVSTVRDPTQLQDMTAEPLPAVGSFGRSEVTGCGYMFGDHFHNGMKPYKHRSHATCPVGLAKLMEVSGESLDEIKKLLQLE